MLQKILSCTGHPSMAKNYLAQMSRSVLRLKSIAPRQHIRCYKRKKNVSHSEVSDSYRPHGLQSVRLLCLWDSPGKNTGVGFHSLLQGIFPTQGLNLDLPLCGQIPCHLSHQGSSNRGGNQTVWVQRRE